MYNFNTLTEHATVDELKFRIKSLPFTCPVPSRKAELVKKLFSALIDLDNLKLTWSRLSDIQQLALQEAVHNQNGYMNAFVFHAKYQQPHPSNKSWNGYKTKDNESDRLLSPFFYPEQRYGSSVLIPDDLLLLLKPHIPMPPEFSLSTTTTIDNEQLCHQETQQFTESELNTLVNTIKDKKLKISEKTGLPSKALLKKLSQQLNEPYHEQASIEDDAVINIKSFGWVQILRAASWVKETNGELQINVKKVSLQQRHCDTVKVLFWDWKERSKLDELSRISEVKGQKGKGKRYLTDTQMRREACIDTLKHCPIGEWVALNDFLRLMTVTNNFFNVTLNPSYLYIGDSTYGRLNDDTFLTDVYTRCLLMEYFATLGLIDIAYVEPENAQNNYFDEWMMDDLEYLSSYDGLKHLRLTKLGAYVLGVTESYTETFASTQTSISLLPKHGVKFLQQPTSSEKFFMLSYADEIANDEWQLSTNKLLSHLENGGELADVQAFLIARDEQPYLPTEIEHLFKTLNKNKIAVKLEERCLLLKCSSEVIAKNIASAPSLKKWCQRVGKDQLIIPEGKEAVFRKLIHELKYAMPITS